MTFDKDSSIHALALAIEKMDVGAIRKLAARFGVDVDTMTAVDPTAKLDAKLAELLSPAKIEDAAKITYWAAKREEKVSTHV